MCQPQRNCIGSIKNGQSSWLAHEYHGHRKHTLFYHALRMHAETDYVTVAKRGCQYGESCLYVVD